MVDLAVLNQNDQQQSSTVLDEDLFVDDDDQTNEESSSNETKTNAKKKDSRNKRKRNGKKKKAPRPAETSESEANKDDENENDDETIEIELVPEQIVLDGAYSEFSKIFEHFKFTNVEGVKVEEKVVEETKVKATGKAAELERLKARMFEDEEEEEKERLENSEKPKLSKKKLKQQTRLSVAALKQLVTRPDVVEMHDVTALDPKLLVFLKAIRNSVTVPRHWCAKRKYLQGKRGFEKPPFDLPDFIKRTGIQSMREAVQEKDQNKSLKQKMREKVRPKVGRIDIDYQKLHDAFFIWQTKPRMSIHGDLYYEGKELETRLKEKKPGNLTDDLRIALGMPTGPNAEKVPPPWLIAMQRYGPPPSYPSLKIPGLNAPIPEGCSFGYHAGGWGKPPVDEFGRPLYGDVFGSTMNDLRKPMEEEPVDITLWGEMENDVYEIAPGEEDEEEEEEEEGAEEEKKDEEAEEDAEIEPDEAAAGLKTPGEGLMTPSGISTTVSAGLETPDMIELRKRKNQIESDMESMGGETPALYKVLPERAAVIGSSMMGSSKVYDLSAAKKVVAGDHLASGITSSIDLALNPDELDITSDVLQSRYDQHLRQKHGASEMDDDAADTSTASVGGSSSSKQAKKRKKEEENAAKAAAATADKDKNKKYKEFKF